MAARRLILALSACAIAAPAVWSGCVAGFDPPSKLNALRVVAVVADKPYANPCEEITFTMSVQDGLNPEEPRPLQIIWLGGCFDPEGDQYYACYDSLAEVFQNLGSCADPTCAQIEICGEPQQIIGIGPQYTLRLPADIITRRPVPDSGPHYGLAYVFFAACAGEVRPVLDEGGRAGSFPLGCFDAEGRRLGADSFVPGYTQVYSFADGRTNANPAAQGMTLDGDPLPEDFTAAPTVARCPLTEDERRASGCGQKDPAEECTTYDIEVLVQSDVAEIDPDAQGSEGEVLTEAVWVDYYADQGDLETAVKLVNDAVEGFNDDRKVTWIPPPEPGIATLWAVVHDARGGSAVVQRFVRVE